MEKVRAWMMERIPRIPFLRGSRTCSSTRARMADGPQGYFRMPRPLSRIRIDVASLFETMDMGHTYGWACRSFCAPIDRSCVLPNTHFIQLFLRERWHGALMRLATDRTRPTEARRGLSPDGRTHNRHYGSVVPSPLGIRSHHALVEPTSGKPRRSARRNSGRRPSQDTNARRVARCPERHPTRSCRPRELHKLPRSRR